jgi:hypothetical protein
MRIVRSLKQRKMYHNLFRLSYSSTARDWRWRGGGLGELFLWLWYFAYIVTFWALVSRFNPPGPGLTLRWP